MYVIRKKKKIFQKLLRILRRVTKAVKSRWKVLTSLGLHCCFVKFHFPCFLMFHRNERGSNRIEDLIVHANRFLISAGFVSKNIESRTLSRSFVIRGITCRCRRCINLRSKSSGANPFQSVNRNLFHQQKLCSPLI